MWENLPRDAPIISDLIAGAISDSPQLAAGLASLAKRGQAALDDDLVARENNKPEHSGMFLPRMRRFLHKLVIGHIPAMTETIATVAGRALSFEGSHQ